MVILISKWLNITDRNRLNDSNVLKLTDWNLHTKTDWLITVYTNFLKLTDLRVKLFTSVWNIFNDWKQLTKTDRLKLSDLNWLTQSELLLPIDWYWFTETSISNQLKDCDRLKLTTKNWQTQLTDWKLLTDTNWLELSDWQASCRPLVLFRLNNYYGHNTSKARLYICKGWKALRIEQSTVQYRSSGLFYDSC